MNWLGDNVRTLSALAAVLIVLITVLVVGKYLKQIKNDTATGELADENWDGIGEFKNPMPIGWSVTFLLTMVWGVWYWLAGYPLNAYSQIGEYNEEVALYNKNFAEKYKNITKDELKEMGKGAFLVQCAPCHGVTGDGISGKAADFEKWGTKQGLVDVMKKGSKGLGYPMGEMPAGLVTDEAEMGKIADFVMAGMSGDGSQLFGTYCASCHGADGKGMNGMAPDVSTYGKTEFVLDVLNRGKSGSIGVMPKFTDGKLNDMQKKAVAAYILSLNK